MPAPPGLTLFDERGALAPMPPLQALTYFLGLIPIPGITDPGRWAEDQHRTAFTLAVATEATLCERMQQLLGEMLETGKVSKGPKAVQALLDGAGVTPQNPQYAEMVTRTNLMDAFTLGTTRELQAAADDFPAWRYDGIRDGREGEDHRQHFGKYFPSSVPFATVRGPRVFNCRCVPTPVYKTAWRRLQERGAAFSSFAESAPGLSCEVREPRLIDLPDVRQLHNFDCGAACTRSVAEYFGVAGGRTEEDFVRELHTKPTDVIEDGTRWQRIVAWLRRAGLTAEAREGMALDDLRAAVAAGRPVIVPLQDYGTREEYRKNESGHYVVVCGFFQGHVVIQDPSAANAESGGRLPDHLPDSIQDFGKLLVREPVFLGAWHDADSTGKVLVHFGIAVAGRKRAVERHVETSAVAAKDARTYGDIAPTPAKHTS